jgi:hypothetical protein
MRRFLAPWLLLLVGMSCGIGATYVGCPGCIERDRVNSTCEWTGDTTFPLDAQNRAHQQHLIADAQLAEDLAVRFADAEHKRLSSYPGHGGLIDNGRVVKECMARLFATIENDHFVTSEQIQVARGQRNRAFDVAVGLWFLPLYSFGATTACRRDWHRFSSHLRYAGLVAMGLVPSLLVIAGVLLFWFIALLRYWAMSHDEPISIDGLAPHGTLLR